MGNFFLGVFIWLAGLALGLSAFLNYAYMEKWLLSLCVIFCVIFIVVSVVPFYLALRDWKDDRQYNKARKAAKARFAADVR